MADREQQGVPLPEIPAFDQSAGILWSEGESEAIKGYCLAYGNARAAAARAQALEEAVRAVLAVQSYVWVSGSDQFGNSCPAKVVATKETFAAAVRALLDKTQAEQGKESP